MRKISLAIAAVAAMSAFAKPAPAVAAWHEAKSKHFIIYADERPDVLQDFATRLEKFDRAVRTARSMTDPELTDSGRIRVYVVSDYANIDRFLGISNARGIYLPRVAGTVAFVPKIDRAKGEIFELNSQTIFFHEYAHHLQLQSTSAPIPKWLIEGSAEFFSTAKIEKDGSVRFGAPANHRAYEIFMGRDLPLRDMLSDTSGKLSDEQVDELYGRGWLLTHYLTFEPSRSGQLDRYVQLIQQGQSPAAAAEGAFGDLKQLEKNLKEYQRRKRLTNLVMNPPASVSQVTIRQLSAPEAAIMSVRSRSDRGVNSKSAPAVAADARAVAARFPNSPVVMTALAEAEIDARNYAASKAAADRAIALDPGNGEALIFKARAITGIANEAKQKADWKEIRALLIRANRLDPDDPEPLMRYYMTFGWAGENPPPSAVKGLLYAAALVPQAKDLRFLATQQLIHDQRWDEAARMFSSIAYNPHQDSETAVKARAVMAAINARDPGAVERAVATFAGDDED